MDFIVDNLVFIALYWLYYICQKKNSDSIRNQGSKNSTEEKVSEGIHRD